MTQSYTHDFQCVYQLQRYPFDTQVGKIIQTDHFQCAHALDGYIGPSDEARENIHKYPQNIKSPQAQSFYTLTGEASNVIGKTGLNGRTPPPVKVQFSQTNKTVLQFGIMEARGHYTLSVWHFCSVTTP